MGAHGGEGADDERLLPEDPIHRLARPVTRFLHVEAAGGATLLAFSVAALALANSPLADAFLDLWKTPLTLGIGSFRMEHSLKHWINDGAMAVFFFVVGLEVKRELVLGELRDPRRAALPVAAALGGMLVPAALYLALQHGQPSARGWGIPMATDIAFVVGCMAVLGRRVPAGLRVALLSIAIVDDVGAILVIAVGYTEALDRAALAAGVAGIAAVMGLQRLGVRSVGIYTVVGAGIWLAFHESGVHATLAGVILGLQTPARSWVGAPTLAEAVRRAGAFLHGDAAPTTPPPRVLADVQTAARESLPPLERLERALHPWTSFVVMPLFALANAGVPVRLAGLTDPVAVAVMTGLAVGKPVGVLAFSAAAVRSGLARLPEGVGWTGLAGGGCLTGIGFTMALFIAGLALESAALDAAKIGILGASLLSAATGMTLLAASRRS